MSTTDDPRKAKCFLYCRTSVDGESKDTSDKASIEEQELNGRKLAQKHNLQVVDVFIDRNRSSRVYPTGYSIPDDEVDTYCRECNFTARQCSRDALGAMIKRLSEVGTIIVRNQDRLMRPEALSYLGPYLLKLFKDAGVVIMSRDGSIIDPSNPRHAKQALEKGSSDGETISQRRQETIDALRKLRDEGRPYFSTSFYGFQYFAPGKPPTRVESEILVVQRIFKDFIAENNIARIVQTLNKEGITPPVRHLDKTKVKGKGPYWNISTVRNILRRTQYAGFQYKTDGEEIESPFFHPPVIDRDIFDQVKAIFEKRSTDPQGRHRDVHALSGLIRCGYCHYNMQIAGTTKKGDKAAKIRYFRCKKVLETAGVTGCASMSIRERMPTALVENGQVSASMAYGIEDCLYPLIFKGIYDSEMAGQRRDGLQQEMLDTEQELTRLRKRVIEADSEQFRKEHGKAADIMLSQRTNAFNEVGQKMERLQRELDNCDFEAVPVPSFDDFANARIDDYTKKLFFTRVIDHVDVFENKIIVYMHGVVDWSFTLHREFVNGGWLLPKWELHAVTPGDADFPVIGSLKMTIRKKIRRTKETKYHIIYKYQRPGPIQQVGGDSELMIVISGLPAEKNTGKR